MEHFSGINKSTFGEVAMILLQKFGVVTSFLSRSVFVFQCTSEGRGLYSEKRLIGLHSRTPR